MKDFRIDNNKPEELIVEEKAQIIEERDNNGVDTNKNYSKAKTKKRRSLSEIIGDWKAPNDYTIEEWWNKL